MFSPRIFVLHRWFSFQVAVFLIAAPYSAAAEPSVVVQCVQLLSQARSLLWSVSLPVLSLLTPDGSELAPGIYGHLDNGNDFAAGELTAVSFDSHYKRALITPSLEVWNWGGRYRLPSMEPLQIQQAIEGLDKHGQKLGFTIPAKTSVLVADNRFGILQSRFNGPFTVRVHNGQYYIVLSRGNGTPKILQSTNTVLHERAHNIIHETFGKDSVIVKYTILNEALVDFFVANFTGNPSVFTEINDIDFHRNVSTRPVISIKDFKDNEHKIGILFSNFLWQQRALIGQPHMNAILFPFIKALNESAITEDRFLNLNSIDILFIEFQKIFNSVLNLR